MQANVNAHFLNAKDIETGRAITNNYGDFCTVAIGGGGGEICLYFPAEAAAKVEEIAALFNGIFADAKAAKRARSTEMVGE